MFVLAAALKAGYTDDVLYQLTKIDKWFLNKMRNIVNCHVKMETLSVIDNKKSCQLHRHPSQQRMDLPAACASRAMPTTAESSHSATGTLYPNCTDGHIPLQSSSSII